MAVQHNYEQAYVRLAQILLAGKKMASTREELIGRCEKRARLMHDALLAAQAAFEAMSSDAHNLSDAEISSIFNAAAKAVNAAI